MIRCLHFVADCPTPTAEAQVAATMADIHRQAAACRESPVKKLAATTEILIGPLDDLVELRDHALLLLGFAGSLHRAELAAMPV